MAEDPVVAQPLMPRERRRSSLQGFKDVFEGLFVAPRLRVASRAALPPSAEPGEQGDGGNEHGEREATFTENFFDLMYVLPMQNLFPLPLGSAEELLLYAMYFATVFNSWLGEAFYNTRFDTDDVVSRALTVVQMVCVAGMASGLSRGLGAGDSTFALSYAAMRAMLVLKYCRVAWHVPKVRLLTLGFIAGFSTSITLWVSSAFVAPPQQAGVALGGLLVDYATPFVLAATPRFKMVPVHPAHMPERFAGFTCLVLAGSLFSVQMQMPPLGAVNDWALAPIFVSALSVALPLSFLSLYCAGVGLPAASFLGEFWGKLRIYGYLYLHMPLALAIMVSSNAAFAAVAVAFSAPGAPVTAQLPPMAQSTRCLMCGGWAVATLVMGIVHALGGAQDSGGSAPAPRVSQRSYGSSARDAPEIVAEKRRVRLRRLKLRRLALRVFSAVVLMVLPLLLGSRSVSVYMTAITCVHVLQVLVTAFRRRRFVAKADRAKRGATGAARRASAILSSAVGVGATSSTGDEPPEQWPPLPRPLPVAGAGTNGDR